MNLLDEEEVEVKPKLSPSRKKILIALALCIILLIIIIMLMSAIKKNAPKKLTLSFDENDIKIEDGDIVVDEKTEEVYISLRKIAELARYDYVNGDYLGKEDKSENSKCYLQGTDQIIGFEANSKEIYKTFLGSPLDNAYFKLNNSIIEKNNSLYISLNDLNVGCNVVYSYSEQDNKIEINSLNNLIEFYKEQIAENGMTVSNDEYENRKVLLYGMIIVADKYSVEDQKLGEGAKYGVLDFNLKSVIGNMYDSMQFNEYAKEFIVSKDGYFGIISTTGKVLERLKYEEIEIINYSPLLYKVKMNNKYGILDEDKNIVVAMDYDAIGINNNEVSKEGEVQKQDGNKIIVIKNIGSDKFTGIIVCNNKKYGIVNLKTGQEIVECVLDRIYYKELKSGKIEYRVIENGIEKTLDDYLNEKNTTVVNFSE